MGRFGAIIHTAGAFVQGIATAENALAKAGTELLARDGGGGGDGVVINVNVVQGRRATGKGLGRSVHGKLSAGQSIVGVRAFMTK